MSIQHCNIAIIIAIVLLQLAANHVTVLRSTLADFYEELDRKLASAGRPPSRRPKSAKGHDADGVATAFLLQVSHPPLSTVNTDVEFNLHKSDEKVLYLVFHLLLVAVVSFVCLYVHTVWHIK